MKIKILLLLLLAGLSFRAHADPILSFDPTGQEVGLGYVVTVDLRISGLGDDIVTAFDLDIHFDNTILQFDDFAFGTGLDVLGFGSIQGVADFGGVISINEVSLDSDLDLMDFQPNDFVLGTFTFTGLNIGISALDVVVFGLAGQFEFDPLLGFDVPLNLTPDLESGSIAVVSEPGMLVLIGLCLAATGIARRRRDLLNTDQVQA